MLIVSAVTSIEYLSQCYDDTWTQPIEQALVCLHSTGNTTLKLKKKAKGKKKCTCSIDDSFKFVKSTQNKQKEPT